MKRFVIMCCWVLVIGHILTEAYPFLPKAWTERTVDIFLKPGFHQPLAFSWYMKFMADDMLTIGVYFIMARMAAMIHRTLFYIISVFLIYHIIDALLFIWDFKRTYGIYWLLVLSSTATVLVLLRTDKMKLVK